MKAEVEGESDELIAVKVTDNSGNKHQLLISKIDGEIDLHEQDRIPLDSDERNTKQEIILQQVRARAIFVAHHETEVNLIETDARLDLFKRAIEAIECISDREFRNFFEDYYRAAVGDPRQEGDFETVPFEAVEFVYLPAIVDEDQPRFERVGDPSYDYIDENDERQMVGSQPDFEPNLLFQHYVVGEDVPFPDGFRDLLTHHLRCQIRDVYLNMGTEPPPEYDLEGMGKIRIHGRPSIDDEYVTG
jgi:hypothetical protein